MQSWIRAIVSSALALSAIAVGESAAGAQTVRGVVTARDVPMPGVVIQLVDSTSAVVARALSNDRGEFRITAAAG